MKLCLDYQDVLCVPKFGTNSYSSRSQAKLLTDITFKNKKILHDVIPIMSANMTSVTTLESVKVLWKHDYISVLPKHINIEDVSDLYYSRQFVSIGLDASVIPKLQKHKEKFIGICIDVANGYMKEFQDFCAEIVKLFPTKIIMAGNVCTGAGAVALAETGVDIIKIGIGAGNFCLTREVTSIGMPMVSCLEECNKALFNYDVKIAADGGITCPGDIVKAFALLADFVMVGSMFAGHTENSEFDSKGVALAYGMSSTLANERFAGGMPDYRSSEGRIVELKCRGSLNETLEHISGGLRSAMTYCGSPSLQGLAFYADIIQVNRQLSHQYDSITIGV